MPTIEHDDVQAGASLEVTVAPKKTLVAAEPAIAGAGCGDHGTVDAFS